MTNVEYLNLDLESILPKKIQFGSSNGEFEASLRDNRFTSPKIEIVYHHFTPNQTGDVLSDGEPDYLCFDIHPTSEGSELTKKLILDITYGDAMMFSFEIQHDGEVEVGHYNGYGSKFDPEYHFYFMENSIQDLINFFNKLGFNVTRDKMNFLDKRLDSFKMEKVRYISDFKSFNLRGQL